MGDLTKMASFFYGKESVSYPELAKRAAKIGALSKESKDKKKWQVRHVIVIDTFLFYFASEKDNNANGIVCTDVTECRAEACGQDGVSNDVTSPPRATISERSSKLHLDQEGFCFKLTQSKLKREFVFAAKTVLPRF